MLLQGRSAWRIRLAHMSARVLMELALDMVWFNHSRLFRAAGWEFGDFRRESLVQFQWAWQMILTGKEATEIKTVRDAGDSLSSRSLQREALLGEAGN